MCKNAVTGKLVFAGLFRGRGGILLLLLNGKLGYYFRLHHAVSRRVCPTSPWESFLFVSVAYSEAYSTYILYANTC
jgi:hypothetical protein